MTDQDTGADSAGQSDTTSDERNLAMLAHLLGIFTSFVGALIIWLIKKEDSAYVNQLRCCS